MEFKVGDKVIGLGKAGDVDITGITGTVAEASAISFQERYLICFDEERDKFHKGNGNFTNAYYVNGIKLSLLKESSGEKPEVGDRVECGQISTRGINLTGMIGTVAKVPTHPAGWYLIKFDKDHPEFYTPNKTGMPGPYFEVLGANLEVIKKKKKRKRSRTKTVRRTIRRKNEI